ncbi:LPS biosynthesis glycosyltransferase [cf. Phormidesmis sp. LEGE 11477]|uniref:LPS biosynthesis glycosyltransferase n=1 Tax=cf. Phormidesmis sp. LEGE 11477 TaxID=1828680 RepID=UPI0018830DA4|nr:LPS biosynthesis glycosyltransferase [cf. Phormidesmis sp. LEGE 11477]MBE9064754.1 LPS biosynthesis glycosyltransferase [cf. Phormidesmis sp. LEGE 11477]
MSRPKPGTHQELLECIGQTLIVAYKEPTEQLTQALSQAGCDCTVLRQVHQPGYETYSPSFLCLLNHCEAWKQALQSDRPTLVVEADFVPVKNFSELPPPFDPSDAEMGIAWLYTCAAQIYSVSNLSQDAKAVRESASKKSQKVAQGYSTAMVAYVITAKSAAALLELAAQIERSPGPRAYSAWDSGIEYFLREAGFHNYVPFRNYGEHGGLPNPEHRQNKLSKAHRADVLYGKLAFAPMYAYEDDQISGWNWWKVRTYARIKGLGRLLLRKYLRAEVVRKSSRGKALIRFAIARHLTL